MRLYTLNVGQGCFAVITFGDEVVAIDCRIPGPSDEAAETVVGVLPGLLRDRKLVGVVLTGFDVDHADPKGIGILVGRYLPRWIMYPGYFKSGGFATRVFTAIRKAEKERSDSAWSLERISVRLDRDAGRVYEDLSKHLRFEVFSPHPADMSTSNNSSLVVRIDPKPGHDGFSYLVTGDTENPRWESINRIFGRRLKSDVMAAPHHGSRGAINEKTMSLVRPETVIVSAGGNNTYGHPHPEAIACYQAGGAEVLSTHQGSSFVTKPGLVWGANTEVWDSAEMKGARRAVR